MSSLDKGPEILWQGCRLEQVVLNLSVNQKYVRANTQMHHLIMSELLDLLRALFTRAESVLVQAPLHGFSGTRVLKIQPFYPHSAGRLVVM